VLVLKGLVGLCFQAGKKGLEINKDAVSDADGEPFRASQGAGWGWTNDPPPLREGAERGGTCWTPKKGRVEDASGTGAGVRGGDRVEICRPRGGFQGPSGPGAAQYVSSDPEGMQAWSQPEIGFQSCDKDTWLEWQGPWRP